MNTPPSSLASLSKSDLKSIVKALNSAQKPQLRDELRRLVTRWKNSSPSGPNLEQMLCDDHVLGEYLRKACRLQYLPTTSGGAQLGLIDGPVLELQEILSRLHRMSAEEGNDNVEILRNSIILFARLTLNPRWMDLAGPCRRCDNFFLRKRKSNNTYCSAACGHAATATDRVREGRVADREQRLGKAREAAEKWKRTPTSREWKAWVEAKTGLNVRFLTRAVNRGELLPPVR